MGLKIFIIPPLVKILAVLAPALPTPAVLAPAPPAVLVMRIVAVALNLLAVALKKKQKKLSIKLRMQVKASSINSLAKKLLVLEAFKNPASIMLTSKVPSFWFVNLKPDVILILKPAMELFLQILLLVSSRWVAIQMLGSRIRCLSTKRLPYLLTAVLILIFPLEILLFRTLLVEQKIWQTKLSVIFPTNFLKK